MPRCAQCDKGQARLNQPGNLCKDCFDKISNDDNNMNFSGSQISGASSLFSSQMQPSAFGFPASTEYNINNSSFLSTSRHTAPQFVRQPAPQSIQTHSFQQNDDTGIDANTPIASMTAGQMLTLIQSQTKPLEEKMVNIDRKLDREINGLKTRVNVLENEVKEQKEKNDSLTHIVVEMQKSLNKIDNNDRVKNLMISGLPEGDIEVEGASLVDDKEKVEKMFNLLEIEGGPWDVERLGKPTTNGKTRIAKVVFPDKEARDKAAEKSIKLKDLGEPWRSIYLNHDKHPVYRYENNRLRKKMNEYRKMPEFQDNPKTRVKIMKGELMVDGNVVDRNTFSSFQ